jgi:hypothetical protein
MDKMGQPHAGDETEQYQHQIRLVALHIFDNERCALTEQVAGKGKNGRPGKGAYQV